MAGARARLASWAPPPMLGLFALFAILPALLPWIGGYTYLGTEVMIWAIFALGYNLLLGYIGATQRWLVGGLWAPLVAGIVGTALCGALVGLFVARRRGIYFSLLTIAFGVMFWFMVFLLDTWTGGEDGLTGIQRGPLVLPPWGALSLRDNLPFYYFVYVFFVLATVVLWRIVHSPFGQVIGAIKQSESRARALGYDTPRYKWVVFTLSTAFAGLAGGLYTLARFGAFAEPMSLQQSGNVVLMCLIGGGFASLRPRAGRGGVPRPPRPLLHPHRPLDAPLRPPLHGHHPLHARGHPGPHPARAPPDRVPRHARRGIGTERGVMPGAPILETRGLRKAFGGHVVLDDVNLRFEPRRLSALIGPNGAGKTTCFNLLTGVLRPDAGTIHFAQRDVTGLAPDRRARIGIGRSFQILNLFNDYTVLENTRMAVPDMRRRGFDLWTPAGEVTAAADKAAAAVRLIGLAGREHVAAKFLSYGQRRLLEIGVALAGEPELLLLDEPTSGLGSRPLETLRALVQRLSERLTIIVIEHDMDFVLSLSHHVAVLHRGTVIAEGPPAAVRDNAEVREAYLGTLRHVGAR